MRKCSECSTEMMEGFVIDGGIDYYCSNECLNKHYTQEEWQDIYNDGNSDSYWTEWEDEDEEN
jgi:hypothetical protein